MEHKIVLGGFEYLPFARSRVAMLKKLGLPYADQSFEINGVSIKVRIEPGHEYISITGGDGSEYAILPSSQTHEDGDVIPRAIATLLPSSLKVKENVDLLIGDHDWISKDGKTVISYSHGEGLRYACGYDRRYLTEAQPGLYIYGEKTETLYNVFGVAKIGSKIIYGRYIKEIIGSIPGTDYHGFTTIVLYVSMGGNGSADYEFARYAIPGEMITSVLPRTVFAQPVFFSGDGLKLVSALCSVNMQFEWGAPYYIFRGSIAVDDDGALSASFFYSVHETAESVVARVTTVEDTNYVPDADKYWYSYNYLQEVIYRDELLGVDITSSGEEKLVTRLTDQKIREVSRTVVDNYGYPVSRSRTSSGSTYYHQSISVNGNLLYDSIETDSGEGTASEIWTTDGNYRRLSSFPQSVGRYHLLSCIDARVNGIAFVVYEKYWSAYTEFYDEFQYQAGTLPTGAGPVLSMSVWLYLNVDGDVSTKGIMNNAVLDTPEKVIAADEMLAGLYDGNGRRVFASRKNKEYLASFSLLTNHINGLSVIGPVTPEPLIVARKKGVRVSVAKSLFTFGNEPLFRIDPVHPI